MPLYMDIHSKMHGTTPKAVEEAHKLDLAAQEKYGVRYLKYWFNEDAGKVFCLAEAPNTDAAITVHREAHGLIPEDIMEVSSHTVDAFLGGMPETPLGGALAHEGGPDGGFRTIVFTDIEGSTSLTQRLGDDSALGLVRAHNRVVRTALGRCSGREVKQTGDGIMASFVSPSKAVECSIEIQRGLSDRNSDDLDGEDVRVRVGISAGEPVEDEDDLFGAAVQLAARACAHARPAQILVSNVVRELCIGKRFTFVDRGRARLKGFERPVHLYEVAWQAGDESG